MATATWFGDWTVAGPGECRLGFSLRPTAVGTGVVRRTIRDSMPSISRASAAFSRQGGGSDLMRNFLSKWARKSTLRDCGNYVRCTEISSVPTFSSHPTDRGYLNIGLPYFWVLADASRLTFQSPRAKGPTIQAIGAVFFPILRCSSHMYWRRSSRRPAAF